MAAELVDIAGKGRLVHGAEGRDGIEMAVHIHERCGAFQLHIVQHKELIVPDGRRKSNESVAKNGFQVVQGIGLIGKGIVPAANAAHEARKPMFLRILKSPGQRRERVHKKAIVLHPRLWRRQLHAGTHPSQHLAVRLPERKKRTIAVSII